MGLLFYTYIRKKSPLKKNILTIVFAAIWFLLVTSLLCIPGTRLPKITWEDKVWLDKWVHIFLFMILVILWSKAYSHKKNTDRDGRKIFLEIMIVGCFYGIAMEFVQKYFIPFRSFDVGDIIADAIGCVVGYLFSIKKFKSV